MTTNINLKLDTSLRADDRLVLANTKDELQRSVYKLENTAKDFNMEVSNIETKIMAFQGKGLIFSDICIHNTVTEL